MRLNQIKTLEDWHEILYIAGVKLTVLEAEAFELGEWITPFVKDDMDWLDAVLKDLEHKLCSALKNRYCNDFSDFIAFLPSVKKVFNRKIADIDYLVIGTQGSHVALIAEEIMKHEHIERRIEQIYERQTPGPTREDEVSQAIQAVWNRT